VKKYYKNGSLNLLFIMISVLYVVIILPVHFCFKFDSKITIIVIVGLLSPHIIYFIVGFYWAFQKISIDKDAIVFYLFNRKIKELPWEEVEEISSNRIRIQFYVIKEKDKNKYYNIYMSKAIESLINKYAPKELFCE